MRLFDHRVPSLLRSPNCERSRLGTDLGGEKDQRKLRPDTEKGL